MNADDLRQVAAEIREKANAATRGPYIARPAGGSGHWIEVQPEDAIEAMGEVLVLGAYGADLPDVEHMMAWHPAVTLAVADWLDTEANYGVFAASGAFAFVKAWRGPRHD